MLGYPEVIALCLYFYVLKAGDMRWVYFEGAGLWWKARYIVIAEILCNVVLNILLAKYWGVLGIILATLISLFFINYIFGAWILFQQYFQNGKLHEFFADHALYAAVTAALAALCTYMCKKIPTDWGFLGLPIKFLLCIALTLTFYYIVYHHTNRYQDAKTWLLSRYRKEE